MLTQMIDDKKLPLKEKFLEYYRELPIQKLAADSIGRHEDTIVLWKKKDSDFSDQIDMARADWAKRTSKGVRSKEWLLERVMKDHFSQRNELANPDGTNLFSNLTDDQLNKLIEAKANQVGVAGTASGEGKKD